MEAPLKKQAGISIGWFRPVAMHPDMEDIIARIEKSADKRLATWNIHTTHVAPTQMSYVAMQGMGSIHLSGRGRDDKPGGIFHFVLQAQNRPVLMTAPVGPANRSVIETPISPLVAPQPFAIGAVELKAGMAIHMDPEMHYQGITQFPVPNTPIHAVKPPTAAIIMVSGFEREDVAGAHDYATKTLELDRGFWAK